MKIIAHPTYFPTIGHFIAFAQAETIVFEREDNFQKQTYRNRTYIYAANGKLLLNIPVKHDKTGQKIKYTNTLIENVEDWQKQHWKSIESAYRTSPFFEYYEDDIKPVFFEQQEQLYDLNIAIFNTLCDCIELEKNVEYTSSFVKEYDNATDLRPLVLAKKGIAINNTPYSQVFDPKYGFLPNLSILDLLFNEGPNTINYLEQQSPLW